MVAARHGKGGRQRLWPRQIPGAISAQCLCVIAPLIGRDFARAAQIYAAQAKTVDLGNDRTVCIQHEKAADNRTNPGLNQGHMAPSDAFASAVIAHTFCAARNEDDLDPFIQPIEECCESDLEARVQQSRVNAILAQFSRYYRRRNDAAKRFIPAGPYLGYALEGGSVDQSVIRKATIKLSAVDPSFHSFPDRLDRGDRFR